MHLQSTHTYHLQQLQSDPHLKYGQKSEVGLVCRNSQRVKAVGCVTYFLSHFHLIFYFYPHLVYEINEMKVTNQVCNRLLSRSCSVVDV